MIMGIGKRTAILFFIIIAFGCSHHGYLEFALSKAGENQQELVKVLSHYKDDSLKYEAACFLIENMVYHHYYENEALDKYKSMLRDILTLSDTIAIEEIRDIFIRDTMTVINQKSLELREARKNPVRDLETITAEYLIANIDHAFMVWETQPWGKHISFEQFCHEILPYRIDDEPLEDWRQTYYDYFQPVLDSLLTDDDPVSACQLVYNAIAKMDWHFITDLSTPHLGGKMLLEYRVGNCREYSDFALYAMRALGLCGGIDLVIQNPDYSSAYHYWNYVRDTTGQINEFKLYGMRPNGTWKENRPKGVVYRHHFCLQKNTLRLQHPDKEIPPTLVTPFLSNVSAEYFPGYNITLPAEKREDLLYLYVFDNKVWKPVTWAEIKKEKAAFYNLDPKVAFFPGYYSAGTVELSGDPFILNEDKSVKFFTPDTVNRIDLVLERKFRTRGHLMGRYEKKTYRGKFEGADNPEFRKAHELFTVSDISKAVYQEKQFPVPVEYRYIRYLSADTLCCDMAEIEFISSEDRVVKGRIIDSGGMFGENTVHGKGTVFDGDPLTYFHTKDTTGGWIGMDFGQPQRIDRIRYLFRNDDNNIREGDQYELFYYTTDGYKKSLGRQTGNREQVLVFENCPSNALYLLHNHTRGKEERIFSYENGKQIFW